MNFILPLFLLESAYDFLHTASFFFHSRKQDENIPIAGYKARKLLLATYMNIKVLGDGNLKLY